MTFPRFPARHLLYHPDCFLITPGSDPFFHLNIRQGTIFFNDKNSTTTPCTPLFMAISGYLRFLLRKRSLASSPPGITRENIDHCGNSTLCFITGTIFCTGLASCCSILISWFSSLVVPVFGFSSSSGGNAVFYNRSKAFLLRCRDIGPWNIIQVVGRGCHLCIFKHIAHVGQVNGLILELGKR